MRRTTKRKEQSGSPTKDSDSSKRMRQTASPVSFDLSEARSVADFGRAVLKLIKESTDSRRGNLIASDFETLPPKASLPEYYTVIRNPIALDTIEAKLDSYQSVQEILDDFKLMETNANTFNKANSLIAQYSTKIRSIVEESVALFDASAKVSSEGPGGESGPSYTVIQDTLLGVVNSILNEVKDSSGESFVGDFFTSLVPKKKYPDYYQIIKNPISLKEIQRNLKNGTYPHETMVTAFEDDIYLMLSNCAEYNEPESEVMKDAKVLEAWFVPAMAQKRKDLKLPPRTLPPEGSRAQNQVKSEDVIMENGIESKPRIILKMNGAKKAGSPSSALGTNSRQTTAASTPAALSSAQSPPPAADSFSRNPFQTSRSPHPAAASPANLMHEQSLSPAVTAATPAQTPQPSQAASAPPVVPVKQDPKIPRYSEFRLGSHAIKNGLIVQPAEPSSYSILRRPGTSERDSPIQAIKFTAQPDTKESRVIPIRSEKDKWRCASLIRLNPGEPNVRFEIYPHPKLFSGPFGIWVQHQGHTPTPLQVPAPESGKLCTYNMRITPGKENILEIIADMMTTDDQGRERVEKAVFWFSLLILPNVSA